MKQPGKPRRTSVAARPGTSGPKLALWKKFLFAFVTCAAFFIAVELGLALFGVHPILYQRDPYVGFSSQMPLFVRDTDSKDPTAMVTAKNKQRIFNFQRF